MSELGFCISRTHISAGVNARPVARAGFNRLKLNCTLRQDRDPLCNCCPYSRSRCSVCVCVACSPCLPNEGRSSHCCMYSAHLLMAAKPCCVSYDRNVTCRSFFILSIPYSASCITASCSWFHRVALSFGPADTFGGHIYASMLTCQGTRNLVPVCIQLPHVLKLAKACLLAASETA